MASQPSSPLHPSPHTSPPTPHHPRTPSPNALTEPPSRPAGEDSFPVLTVNGTFAGFGFPGAPLATATTLWFQLAFLCAFCFGVKKFHAKYWGGWTCRSFRRDRVAKYLKIVVPMTVGSVRHCSL